MTPRGKVGPGQELSFLLAVWLLSGTAVMLVNSSPLTNARDRHVFPMTVNKDKMHASSLCREFPDILHVNVVASDPFPQSLVLYRKDVINTDVPVYVIKSSNEGFVFTERVENYQKEETAAYQNEEYGATFTAKCDALDRVIMMGSLYVEGRKYRVRHHSDVTSQAETTSFYEFSHVNHTFHNDDIFQGEVRDPESHTSTIDVTQDEDRATRAERNVEDYYIDVLVALDYAFYKFWLGKTENNPEKALQQAKEYVAYIYNEIHSRYNKLSLPNIRLNVLLSGFLIAQTPDASPWTEDVKVATSSGDYQVKAETVLSKLEEFVKNNNSSLPSHDHLMLITEYDLYSEDNGFRFNNTAGLAYINTTCQKNGRSVSVVEDHGGFQSETTATHEIGHSLGASHDGQDNNCDSDDRYVMSGGVHPVTSANKFNPWRFSSCSTSAFTKYFQTVVANKLGDCLTNRITPKNVPTVSGYPGQLSGPDKQCRQIYGPSSYLCRGGQFGAPEDICLSMYCRNPATPSSCTLNTAAAGTCCGNQKWCIEGKCVQTSNATCYMSGTCPFGQRQGVIAQKKTCDQLESGYCYETNFRQVCCEMCDKQHRNIPGCEYGDHVRNCNASYCGRSKRYDALCCATCDFSSSTRPPITTPAGTTTLINRVPDLVDTCRDTVLINGTEPCGDFLDRAGLAYCCQPKVQGFCCKSCNARRNVNDFSCPYGDCQLCSNLLLKPLRCNDTERQQCCRTCQELDRRYRTTITPIRKTTQGKKCDKTTGGDICGVGSLVPQRWMIWLGVVMSWWVVLFRVGF